MKLFILTGLSMCLAGCISTQEMPLAPNVVRLDTQASGRIFTAQTVPQTMRRAAELTLQAGYTNFRFQDASSTQGEQLAGVYTTGGTTTNLSGNAYQAGPMTYVNGTANTTGSATALPIMRPTSNVGVTVIMLRKGDSGFENSFDAADVLKKYTS